MKAKKLTCMAAVVILIAVTNPAGVSAQEQASPQEHKSKNSHYKVVDLGTFGGPHSAVNSDSVNTNAKGTVVGGASTSTPDPACTFDSQCFVFHAFKYRKNVVIDLGTLPGGTNSSAIAINSPGTIAGISENGVIDPITGVAEFVATVWKNNQVLNLGTFGGSFSLPNAINDRGQVAGGAETTIPDPDNLGGALIGLPSPSQWHAALWQDEIPLDIGTLGTGPDSFALFVNKSGQVAGISFTNSIVNPETGIPTVDPFFWENGKMVDVGSLGGVLGTVSALNNRAQVTGTSDVTRDGAVYHAFLWEHGQLQDLGTFGGDFSFGNWIDDSGEVVGGATTKDNLLFRAARWKNGHMTNLGSLNGDPCSFAVGSNSKGQIIGNSVSGECEHDLHPFLWENGGPMVDLNTLIPPNSGLVLHEAQYINERGEITGAAFLPNGEEHAFLLIPCDENHPKTEGCEDASPATDATQSTEAPTTAPATAVFHPKLTPRDMAARFRARLVRGYRTQPAVVTESAPTNLSSIAFRRGLGDVVDLGWTNNSTDDDSFHIEFCFGSTCTNFKEIGQTGANVTHFTAFFQFDFHKTVRFRVRAHGPEGYSGYSNIRTNTLP